MITAGMVCRRVTGFVLVMGLAGSTWADATPTSNGSTIQQTTATSTVASTLTTGKADADPVTTAARIWNNRMVAFQRENGRIEIEDGTTNTGYIVLLGDSITQGFPHAKLFPDVPIVNRGISSDQVGDSEKPDGRGVINRLEESVWRCHPRHVFLLIGVNDIGSGIRGERLEKRHAAVLTALMEGLPATSITLQTILPARGRFAKLNEFIIDSNERLRKLADERGITVLDLHNEMAGPDGLLREDFTSDGLHLNAKANEAWAGLLRGELERLDYLPKKAVAKLPAGSDKQNR